MAKAAPTIEFLWAEPEAEITAQNLIELSYALEDFTKPLATAAALTRLDIKERFSTGTDPGGYAWAPWAKPPQQASNYDAWARKHTTGPVFGDRANLHLTGALENAMLAPSTYVATDDSMFIDTGGLPEYWAWNNFGAERVAAHSDVFGDQENYLPERPFVGISTAVKAKIEAGFIGWFEDEVQLARSSKGNLFFRHVKKGRGSRFAKR